MIRKINSSKLYTEWGTCGLRNNKRRNYVTVKGIYLSYGLLFFLLSLLFIILDTSIIIVSFSYLLLTSAFLYSIRRKVIQYFKRIEIIMDEIIDSGVVDETKIDYNDDLLSKLLFKLWKMSSIQQQTKERIEKERNEVEEMVSDIAHQVKTPMTNVKMYQEILLNKLSGNTDCEEIVSVIQSQINKLDFLIQSILKISELEIGIINLRKDKYLLCACFKEALESVIFYAKRKNIRINVHDKMKAEVYCDMKWSAEAIFNILDNAIKYTQINGTIDIFSHTIGVYACLIIKDNGIGIENENISNIFKRFYREINDGQTEGVGIGLSLAREIIMKQGGYIVVNSEKNKGSVFSIYLPQNKFVSGNHNEKM